MRIDAVLRFPEQHPRLGALPTPAIFSRVIEAHQRRRRLVVEIAALSDRRTATAALWWARAVALATSGEVPVESSLVATRALFMAGAVGNAPPR